MIPKLYSLLTFLKRNVLLIIIGLAAIVGFSFLRACYYTGKASQQLATPALTNKENKAANARIATLERQVATATAIADSLRIVITAQQATVVIHQATVQNLTHAYHEVLVTPRATAAELQRTLANYTPGADF